MVAPITVRKFLQQQLKPVLPSTWRWIPAQRNLDTIDRITIVYKQTRIIRLPAAPIGTLSVEGTLTIIDPHQDVTRAEEALDDSVLAVVTAIDGLVTVAWAGAEKVLVNDQYIGWDITVSVITKKE